MFGRSGSEGTPVASPVNDGIPAVMMDEVGAEALVAADCCEYVYHWSNVLLPVPARSHGLGGELVLIFREALSIESQCWRRGMQSSNEMYVEGSRSIKLMRRRREDPATNNAGRGLGSFARI